MLFSQNQIYIVLKKSIARDDEQIVAVFYRLPITCFQIYDVNPRASGLT